MAHIQKKLDSARKSLAQAKKADAAHEQDIRELEDELAEVDRKRKEYEDMVAGESQSQGKDVHLEDAQVRVHILLARDTSRYKLKMSLDILYMVLH